MTNSLPSDPQSEDQRQQDTILEFDEWVAVIVAFLAVGSILAWGWTRGQQEGWFAQPQTGSPVQVSDAKSSDEMRSPTAPTLEREDKPSQSLPRKAEQIQQDGTQYVGHAMGQADLSTLARGQSQRGDRTPIMPSDIQVTTPPPVVPNASTVVPNAPTPSTESTNPATTPIPPTGTTPGAPSSPADPTNTAPVASAPTPSFSDVPTDYWAANYIQAMAAKGLLSGMIENQFQPDALITRAQYAALVQKVFALTSRRAPVTFSDVAENNWAKGAINQAVQGGFLSGYPDGTFRPGASITRMEVLLSLASGLDLALPPNQDALQVYGDRTTIPPWAAPALAATTETGLVVLYPDVNQLNPNQPATRSEVAAMMYEVLVHRGDAEPITSPYQVQP